MAYDIPKAQSAPAAFAPEVLVQQIARFIAQSGCPEITRHEILVLLKRFIAAEMAVVLKMRVAAPDWPDRFVA